MSPVAIDDAPIPVHERTIALVGLMGVGKSTVGRRLAKRLGLPFADGDIEIEAAAAMTVSEIFAQLGEAEFRAGEARVLKRLLHAPRMVLATGGGAVLNPETRAELKARAVTVWMRADLETVASRVQRRDTRPLLRGRDPLEALRAMAEVRYPFYACADVVVDVASGAHAEAVECIVRALEAYWAEAVV
ncbi:MAG: shikimate kinase [Brevundimonas sp.]|uniref:shikimate kinase n=1 Tax=Brevundimonas sp. TaxID=1871086 RepID=UPI0027248465|nr:shikimate kinase [Brevundimonas sp.]MDO9077480.1 shikimate kinase [Brevundimonas sp.]MDP3080927.1 shikimate kinase [Brevundimonas sp.]MDZ4061890.1 shikimate kinase [Brevundimonas sp.]